MTESKPSHSMISRRVAPCLTAFVIVVLMSGCSTCGTPRFSGLREAPKRLAPGAATFVVVLARSQWTSTGVYARPGETYRFQGLPPDRWYDLIIVTNSCGYPSQSSIQRRAEKCRRVASAPWFALCASVEPTGTPFVLCGKSEVPIPARGEIGLFANDAPAAYWNNFGRLKVRITRLR
ncbi:MAG: hypothetical protein V7609_669 [Verrucomicrobiota bacterium]